MGKRKYDISKEQTSKKPRNDLKDGNNENEVVGSRNDPSSVVTELHNVFDIKQFRKEIATKQGQTIALTRFLQVCVTPDSGVDYMLEYLKSGGNSHEILRQIGQDHKRNLTLATPAFHLFHLIILKVQSTLPHMIAINEEACRYFLNTFMPTVEIMISENSGPRHRKIVLKLLTSIVTFNPDLGIEVLNQAPLTPKHLQHIVEKINYKEKDNVRVAFVHFITSFLVDGHLPLIKALLEKQGLLQLVIPGLIQDEAEAVLMFLHTLKENVIYNRFLSKSLKLKTFSHQVIHNLFKLYNWKGPSDVKYEIKKEAHSEIMQLVSDILLTLFTNHKIGIYFMDSSLGTSENNKNQNLYKALLTLKRPWENENQCDVILQIVKKCPDLHRAIIHIVEQSFEPQQSPIWERAVGFVLKLLTILKPEDMLPKLSSLSSMQVANFIRFTTLPVPLLKFLQQSICGNDMLIALYGIKVLVKMLSSLKRYIELLGLNNLKANVFELKVKLETFIPKHLPGSSSILLLIQKNIKELSTEEPSNSGYRLTELDRGDTLISLIDLLLYYQFIHPSFIEGIESDLNMKEILEFATTLSCSNTSLLKFKVVSLWISLDSTAISLKNPMFKPLLLIMLEVYTNDSDNTWVVAKDTLHIFFKNTSIYDTDENEIHIMLYTLRYSKVAPSIVADLMEYILSNYEALVDLIRSKNIDTEMISNIDQDYLNSLFDDLMENQNTEHTQLLDTKIPSLFVVGSVQFMKGRKGTRKKIQQFLSLYVMNLLHCNYSPETIKILIEDSKLDIESYVSEWFEKPNPISDTICAKDDILKKIGLSILNEDYSENVLPFDENSKDYVEFVDSSALIMWVQYLIFCIVKLAKMGKLNDCQQEKILNYFKIVMHVCEKTHRLEVCRNVIANIFKSSYVLDIYAPVHSKKYSNILATKFLLDVVSSYPDIVQYLSRRVDLLKPFKQKNYDELAKCLIKIKKLKNYDNEQTSRVLEVIGMDQKYQLNTLENIFQIDVCYLANAGKEFSLVINVLRVIIDKHSDMIETDFSRKYLEQIMNWYIKIIQEKEANTNISNLENSLIHYFENKPHTAKLIDEGLYKLFFDCKSTRKCTWELAAVLLKLNKKLFGTFKEQLQKPEILGQREIILSLGNVAIEQKQFLSDQSLLDIVYEEYKSNIFKIIEKPHKAGQSYTTNWKFIRELLLKCANAEDCARVFSKPHRFEVVEISHVSLFHSLFLKSCIVWNEQKKEYLINYFLTMLTLLTQALKESKTDETVYNIVRKIYLIYVISKDFVQFDLKDKENFGKLTENPIWHNFCKVVLRHCLKIKTVHENFEYGPQLLCLLTALVSFVYPSGHEDLSQLFDMVTSHSEFLNVMLSHHSLDIKSRLVELLFVLIYKDKSVMKAQQIPVYLSAYHATRSSCDRMILKILHFYETQGLAVHEYKPYIWGDSAANHYAVRKNRTASLWGRPTPNQVLNLFDRSVTQNTMKYFPVTQKLDYDFQLHTNIDVSGSGLPSDESIPTLFDKMCKDGVFRLRQEKDNIDAMILRCKYENVLNTMRNTELQLVSHEVEYMQKEETYDPAFVLPLLSHLLVPGSIVSCFKLFRSGLLCVPLMALSSLCPLMRAAAYHVLHRFYLQLENEMKHKNDKLMLTDFIDTLRQSLPSVVATGQTTCETLKEFRNPRVPSVDAMYLAKALSVATAPSDPLYKPVNNFLIAKQFVDFTTVPDFLTLFHDSDVESADRRYWILDVIRDGTKTMSDVVVVFKTMCLKMIMDFYSSVMSDRKTKEKILNVVSSLVSVPRAAEILVQGYGFTPWMSSVIRNLKNDATLVKLVMGVIRNYICSVQVNAFYRMFVAAQKAKTVLNIGELKISRDVETDVLIMLYDLLPFTHNLELDDYLYYLRTLNMLSNNVMKLLRKRQIENLINVSSERMKNGEFSKLLVRAVNINDVSLLKSRKLLIDNNIEDVVSNVKREMLAIINKYMN